MSEDRCLLEQTFALTSQKFEGTIALLDVSVDLRKIPATIEKETDGRVVITTTRRYAQKRILHDHDIAELEGSDDGRSEGGEGETAEDTHTGAIAPETPPESAEEEEETEPEETPSEASDITERNSDLPPPPYEQEQSPPHRRQDRFTSLRSPSPPGTITIAICFPKFLFVPSCLKARRLPDPGRSTPAAVPLNNSCEDATVLKKTFALTAQRRKGTIVLLDVQAKIRKIPATIISDDEEHVEITTDPRYLPGVEDSMGFVIEPKEEPCDIEEELEEEVNDDEPVLELEEISDEDGDSEKENIATNQQTNQQTLIINLTISDDVHEDDMQSDTTELNPDVPSTVPLTNPTNDVAQTPQRPTK
ncbi:hypothetical protein DAPPUDRAFT_331278 [Daphnia pulex]|uniref:Uncharacterized protein n=1 Tax=Daphnia pulex TaxID=6669 RepID=E9HLZ9_DAPPU|nr:hypothetical protein DAPPUDRAFT_331278 [Daphnia pulex]|eukprot:EFX67238.1 hypothetical protein DAPPUDRAFT_331278 [Daphnia pulex]